MKKGPPSRLAERGPEPGLRPDGAARQLASPAVAGTCARPGRSRRRRRRR